MPDEYERTPYPHAVFTCTACGQSTGCNYRQVSSLLEGQALDCPSCGAATMLSDDGLRELNEQMNRAAGFGRWMVIGGGLYLLLCFGVMVVFSMFMAGIVLAAGLLVVWLANSARSSRQVLNLELFPLSEAGQGTETAR